MGYFLLYESKLDTVLYTRDKWLNKDGYVKIKLKLPLLQLLFIVELLPFCLIAFFLKALS
jgi:hypothetical protein